MSIKDMVKDNVVKFCYYRKGEFWYSLEYGEEKKIFMFPVPIDDAGEATLYNQDKALLFMRYIRKHLNAVDNQSESV